MTFKPGDRVRYVSGNHGMSLDNPLVGTRYECIGTIDYAEEVHVSVQWDNGKHNSYVPIDLHLATDDVVANPNLAFKVKRAGRKRYNGG